MSLDAVPWEGAELPVLDEPMMADWHRARGRVLVEHHDRRWVQLRPGFLQPLHHLARVPATEATRPAWWCISFRARLGEADAAAANASLPVHLMERVDRYDIGNLPSRRRQEIRQALRNLEVVALRAPDLVLEEGYRVAQEARARNRHIALPDRKTFRREITNLLDPPRGVVLAALRDRRLLGFATGFAAGTAVYHDVVYVGDKGLPHHVSLCLFHALATLAARSGTIREMMHGLHIPDDPGLGEFKRRIGLPVVPLPVKFWFAPGVHTLVRRLMPKKYYHWSGTALAGSVSLDQAGRAEATGSGRG